MHALRSTWVANAHRTMPAHFCVCVCVCVQSLTYGHSYSLALTSSQSVHQCLEFPCPQKATQEERLATRYCGILDPLGQPTLLPFAIAESFAHPVPGLFNDCSCCFDLDAQRHRGTTLHFTMSVRVRIRISVIDIAPSGVCNLLHSAFCDLFFD